MSVFKVVLTLAGIAVVVVAVPILVGVGFIAFEILHCDSFVRSGSWVQDNLPAEVYESPLGYTIENGSLTGRFYHLDGYEPYLMRFSVTHNPDDVVPTVEEFDSLLAELYDAQGWPPPPPHPSKKVCTEVI